MDHIKEVIVLNFENIVAAFIAGLSLFLFVVSIRSYQRSGKKKVLIIGMAFLLFFIKGLVLTVTLFLFIPLGTQVVYLGMFDMIILIVLFAALSIKK